VIVDRYKRRPAHVIVCYLRPDGVPVSEQGRELSFDHWPERHRLWCSFDVARSLVLDGYGESLCWKNEDVRWRHLRDPEPGWTRRPTDAAVIRLPLEELEPEQVLHGLARWRDWLEAAGAGAVGTVGSASWSLLRATLQRPLFTPKRGAPPPLHFTLGGRQQLGPAGPGSFEGRIEQVDMQAAYARTLGALEYGGRWLDAAQLGAGRDPERFARDDRPLFVRARVRIPAELAYGPLPDRPRSADHPYLRLGLGPEYPVGVTLQRLWTWQELQAAEQAGCKVMRVVDFWVHLAGAERRPFAPWLEQVERGRRMRGLAGLLAKMTGNALVGRFSMRSGEPQLRTIRTRHGTTTTRRLAGGSFTMPAAHDLAETVTGRVRARVFTAMMELEDALLSMHTDGGWRLAGGAATTEGWRVKGHASRLDLLGPQVLRYHPLHGEPVAVVAGVPPLYAADSFERLWSEAGFD
jgi:hypothetical protein